MYRFKRFPTATVALGLVALACGGGHTPVAELRDSAAVVRSSPFLGCYTLSTGAWDGGVVVYQEIRKPQWLRLDSVPEGIPLHAAFRAETDPLIGGGLDHVGWWPVGRDTAMVYATEGGWSGYMMTLIVDGDSIRGLAEETSDLIGPYRKHTVRGKRRPCPPQ
jgi:hypothetical protein